MTGVHPPQGWTADPGREVSAGDLLAEIDQRPFQADLDRAKAQLAEARARATRTEGTFQRLSAGREKGAVSEEEFQRALGERNEAAAAVDLSRAAESLAALNLEYSTIKSPLSGVAGDRQVDAGNLISGGVQSASLLTTVVAVDPILVAFEMDEITLQKLQESIRSGRLILPSGGLSLITRYNSVPAASINGSSSPGVSSGEMIGVVDRLDAEKLPPGMDTEWTELTLLQIRAGNTAIVVFLLAVVLVGLASKNAILIVEFAREKRKAGASVADATTEACRLRLRPILMTSLAFILGVVPLVFAKGAGAEMRSTLGIAVFAGMLGVTVFGIFLTPVFFQLMETRDPKESPIRVPQA